MYDAALPAVAWLEGDPPVPLGMIETCAFTLDPGIVAPFAGTPEWSVTVSGMMTGKAMSAAMDAFFPGWRTLRSWPLAVDGHAYQRRLRARRKRRRR